MFKSVMGMGEKNQPAKSRKGCMRGKGGPENAACTYKELCTPPIGIHLVTNEVRTQQSSVGTNVSSSESVGENEMGIDTIWENLNANLPDFDDSSMWAEAGASMDFQAMTDSGIFFEDGMRPWC
ncbi:hypothetical protein Acr_04g0009430 [Actinidia rufa]|uniref:Uncharacterized protein n=1 Tax=Actinidia rufa TaxID=165716 RepID=A0A7J0EIA4_9ERIC|nr:hypothetical protein Acr_04g0009430 [Actinidia rufa]